jgi:hypothetical protein
MNKTWDVKRIALLGAIVGGLYGLWKGWSGIAAGGEAAWYGVGSVVGAAIGGVAVAVIATLIRNRFAR